MRHAHNRRSIGIRLDRHIAGIRLDDFKGGEILAEILYNPTLLEQCIDLH